MNFGLVTLEAMFSMISTNAFKNGIIVDRARFWHSQGQIFIGPAGLLKLFELGVTDIFWLGQFNAPAAPPRGILKGRG